MQIKLYEIAKKYHEQSKTVEEKNRYYLIMNILKDKDSLKKMKTEVAYHIIEDLGFQENDVKEIYNRLLEEVL